MTKPINYKRHRFPPEIIAHAVWLYFRFPLSLRMVEEMLAERGIVVSYQTIRRWGGNSARLRRKHPPRRPAAVTTGTWTNSSSPSPAGSTGCGGPSTRMAIVLDEIVQSRRNTKAARRLLKPAPEEAGPPASTDDHRQAPFVCAARRPWVTGRGSASDAAEQGSGLSVMCRSAPGGGRLLACCAEELD